MSDFLKEERSASNAYPLQINKLKTTAPHLNHLNIKKAGLILRAINHKLRQEMIQFIDGRGQVTVTELFVEMRMEQSVASQHLAILRRAGIVKTKREGKFMYYSLNLERLELLNQMVTDLLK
jgi:DNA-binding transcriptional ArsR family regulator